MIDPVEAAGYRMLPHLLLESETVWTRSSFVDPLINQIKARIYEKTIWEKRLGSLLSFGDSALQEATRNLDFPAGAMFFLQTAHAYYITALADALKINTTSLLTKPMTKLKRMAAESGCALTESLTVNLHLNTEPSASLIALRRVYDAVNARCDSQRIQGMNERTWGHYVYSISSLEFKYREAVGAALIRKRDYANANFYLRFWAYSLARCPVVSEDARQGKKPSFYVPFRAFKKSLTEVCPEIFEDVRLILGGELAPDEAEVSIKGTAHFRQIVVEKILEKGLTPVPLREVSMADIGVH
jgi:hypothetical protein